MHQVLRQKIKCCLPNHAWSGQCHRTTLMLYEHREIYNNIQCCIVTCIRSHSTFENKLNKKKKTKKKKQTHDQGHHFWTKLFKTVFVIYFKTSNTTMCIKTHMVRSKVFCVDIPMMEFVRCILFLLACQVIQVFVVVFAPYFFQH